MDSMYYFGSLTSTGFKYEDAAAVEQAKVTATSIMLGGINTIATGNISIISNGNTINLGNNTTTNINIESNDTTTLTSQDIALVSGDLLSLISATGNIQIGQDINNPIFKIYNNNLLVNQASSTLDRQLDVYVSDSSTNKTGYNGIVVNTGNTSVASELSCQTSNLLSIVSLGVQPNSSNVSNYQEYIAYQTGNAVIRINGP